jgi:environmental stress-induced protein Ves
VRLVRSTGSPRTPWRNGAGWTRPVAQWPAEAGFDEFAWRVSCAEIAGDARFSTFPGIRREFMLVDGGPLTLVVDGDRHVVEREQTLRFAGDAQVACHLAGGLPAVALNVMTRRGAATASVAVAPVRQGLALTAPEDGGLVVFALTSQTFVGVERESLGRFDAVWCGAAEHVTLGGAGRVAVVRVLPDHR